jgi:hypothetical protein
VRLINAELAVVDLVKLRDYILNPAHPRGRHKARVFASALGIFQSDAAFLRKELIKAVLTTDAMAGECDAFGQRYALDFECVRGELRAKIRSGWIVLTAENVPRLTTCFVL